MAKLLLQDSPVKPLPQSIRQRLTLQSALLTNPARFVTKTKRGRSRRTDEETDIQEREVPKPTVVSERTQTKDVMDAETNTKTTILLESQKSRLKDRCTTALAMGASLATRSPYVEIARRLREEINSKQKKRPLTKESPKDVPCLRRRGILKKVLEDVTLEGMASTGTTTDKKQPTLDRILKENHIFLKYSKSFKSKKKRVRMDKKPVLSYFTKRPEEDSVLSLKNSEQSLKASVQSLQAEKERPKVGNDNCEHVAFADDVGDNSSLVSDASDDNANLERKPARLALRASAGDLDDGLDALDRTGTRINTSNLPSVPRLSVGEKFSDEPPKRIPCRVPKDRLCFKNVFFGYPSPVTRKG